MSNGLSVGRLDLTLSYLLLTETREKIIYGDVVRGYSEYEALEFALLALSVSLSIMLAKYLVRYFQAN